MSDSMIGMLILAACIIANALMYCFGEACRRAGEKEIEKKAQESVFLAKKAKKLLEIMEHPQKFVRTVHVATMLMAVAAGHYQVGMYSGAVRSFMVDYLTEDFISLVSYSFAGFYLIFLMLALGVIIPKKIGGKYSLAIAFGLVRFATIVMFILAPITAFISFFSNLVLKIFGIGTGEESYNVTEEEIISIVKEGHEQGVLLAGEAEMIHNIIEFSDKDAGDIMTHRKSIIAVDGGKTLKETVGFILKENNSRFPVYVDNIDNIIGIVHIRDVVECYYEGGKEDSILKDVQGLIRGVEFIPETRSIDTLFREMQTSKEHMKIVVDEYGQTTGLITMEDILEEIVGNIMDEYDEDENNIIREGEDTYIIKGSANLEEITDELSIEFDVDEYDTLNGYLISKLNRIPDDGDKPVFTAGNVTYEILSVENRMISEVRLTINRSGDDNAGGGLSGAEYTEAED